MKKLICCFLILISVTFRSAATSIPDEGMWLPLLVERLNYVDMQKMGLHLTAEELYNINHSSLKDAIVGLANAEAPTSFFCTAEVISKEGLLLTNHHCGFEAVQEQSSVEHDYLTDGFWAMNKSEELPNESMVAAFLVRMEDVTTKVLQAVSDTMTESARSAAIKKVSDNLKKEASEKGKYTVSVKGFFDGNEYYMFVYQIYKDVRLVAAPPSSIGKFGGDTDNWMWPRHTGDFSMLRVYTAADGTSAAYSKENIPLKPKHSLPISLKGVKKGDFAMIWGYPGQTDRYLTSLGVKEAIEKTNPAIVKIRDTKLSIMKEDMDASKDIKIKYSAKYAGTANYWKYFIGQTKGLKRLDVYDKKLQQEVAFQKWADADAQRKEKYGNALPNIAEGYKQLGSSSLTFKYLEEAVFQGPEFIYFSLGSMGLYGTLKQQYDAKKDQKKNYNDAIRAAAESFKEEAKTFFKDYNMATDKKLFISLLKMYYNDLPKDQYPSVFLTIEKKYKGSFEKYADYVYAKSIFVDQKKLDAFLDKPSYKVIENDPGFAIFLSMYNLIRESSAKIGTAQTLISKGERLYAAGLREMNPTKKYYPNANSTMRVSYGQVLDYFPADAIHYNYFTTIEGIMEKEDSTNEEFVVSKKLKDLYAKKDYGRYGQNGEMQVCFLTNNDITGGNSGSPVINGDGQLIGIAFDGNWEAMSGDIAYEAELQRTINVDIRYVLFIIDKYAGATNLINEMTLVQ